MRSFSSPVPLSPRLAAAPWILVAALAAAGSARAQAVNAPPSSAPAGCEFTMEMLQKKAVPAAQFAACAQSVSKSGDTRHGTGDAQRLAVSDSTGKLHYGPFATIVPIRGVPGVPSVTEVSDALLAHGAPLAVIDSKGRYAALGMRKGLNVLIVAVADGESTGTAVMVPLDGGRPKYLGVTVEAHADPADQPLATARWIWSASDETIWVACGRKCCRVTPEQ
jgi:hypothetical protein